MPEPDVNGHGPDIDIDAPEVSPAQSNERGGYNPDLEGMFTSRGGNFFNPGKELVTASTKPEEYMPRTVITEKDWKRKKRIIANSHYRKYGRINIEYLTWLDLIIAPAFDGRAREELVEVSIGVRDLARQGMQMVGGKGLHKEELRR